METEKKHQLHRESKHSLRLVIAGIEKEGLISIWPEKIADGSSLLSKLSCCRNKKRSSKGSAFQVLRVEIVHRKKTMFLGQSQVRVGFDLIPIAEKPSSAASVDISRTVTWFDTQDSRKLFPRYLKYPKSHQRSVCMSLYRADRPSYRRRLAIQQSTQKSHQPEYKKLFL